MGTFERSLLIKVISYLIAFFSRKWVVMHKEEVENLVRDYLRQASELGVTFHVSDDSPLRAKVGDLDQEDSVSLGGTSGKPGTPVDQLSEIVPG